MPEIHTPQDFKQRKSNKNNNVIHQEQMYCILLVENIIFLKNQHAQGHTYIPIIGFPDPNYGIKAINYNKLSSPIVSSLSTPLCVTQRPLSFSFVGPNVEFYIDPISLIRPNSFMIRLGWIYKKSHKPNPTHKFFIGFNNKFTQI